MKNIRLRKVITFVAIANLVYFGVEFTVARFIESVSLFADSVDFLEDASVNLLILLALGMSLKARARMGALLATLLLLPGLFTLLTAWKKFNSLAPPESLLLSVTGAGALAVNLTCAYLLARYRHSGGSLTKAAFLSSRNDAFANIAIIGAGLVTAHTLSGWPDLIVGVGIAILNADAAYEVWEAARKEYQEANV